MAFALVALARYTRPAANTAVKIVRFFIGGLLTSENAV
jgi:hypothetical protein